MSYNIINQELMMNLEPFVWTAELKSFSAAARRLGVSPAAVSKAVARLEDDLGVRLLERTSRRVGLTPEGEVWLAHCRIALDALNAGRERVQRAADAPRGEVRITTSPVLGARVGTALARLLDRHPDLRITLAFTDIIESLASDEADIAIRLGALDDSALIARRVATCRWTTVASPAYLARAPTLARPEDLSAHRCLKFVGPAGRVREWSFAGADVAVPSTMRIGNGNALVQAAIAGVGVVQGFDFLVRDALDDGRLVRVLERYETPGPPIHLLCRPQGRDTVRVRVVLDHLADAFSG